MNTFGPDRTSGLMKSGYFQPPATQEDQLQLTSFSEQMLDLVPDPIVVLDSELTIRVTNTAFRRLMESAGLLHAIGQGFIDHPLGSSAVVVFGSRQTLAGALRSVMQTGNRLTLEDVELATGTAAVGRYSLHAARWDSPGLGTSRIMIWLRSLKQARSADSQPTSERSAAGNGLPPEDASQRTERKIASLVTALDLFTDFDRLCREVLDIALDVTGGASGSLMLVDENGRDLFIAAARGLPESVVRKTRLRVGEGIAGRVAETGEPLVLNGRVGDARFRGVGGRDQISSSVCIPLKADRKVIGVINLNSPAEGKPFDDAICKRVTKLTDPLGSVLYRSEQFKALRRRSLELTIRAEIEAIAFSGLSLEQKLRNLVEPVERLLDVDNFMLYLLDPASQTLSLAAHSGPTISARAEISIPVGLGVPGWVAKNKAPVTLCGYDDRNSTTGVPPVSCVGVPILHRENVIGVIVMEDTSGVANLNAIRETAASFASAIGLVILEAQSQDESRRKLTMLSALSEMGVALTDSADAASFAKLTAYCAVTLLERDMALVRLLPEGSVGLVTEPSSLELMATHGTAAPEPGESLHHLESLLIGEVIRSRQIRSATSSPDLQSALVETGLSDALCIPLLSGDSLIGAITICSAGTRSTPLSLDHEVEVGSRLGDYAAAAARRFVPMAA